ncbi:SubName: Full=Uncharacterized protein {ECO:0000313/EMBL:CCA72305.1} [Serendipita indica DSM 11827]|nr:SubName: Full=Uncharacterized protein {ECO:0000313/EMBL:CCA72305.1} [Serendipita indica DSM 11827]
MLVIYLLSALLNDLSPRDKFGHGLIGVSALTFDAHTHRLWKDNEFAVKEIEQQRLCRDGSMPQLEKIEPKGELTMYEFACDKGSQRNTSLGTRGLYERQSAPICTTSCSQECYRPADYIPDPADCRSIADELKSRNDSLPIGAGVVQAIRRNTCMYMLANQGETALSFCGWALGSIGESIATNCGAGQANPAKGGICSNSEFYVTVVRTPNKPVSSSSDSSSSTSGGHPDSTANASVSSPTSTSSSNARLRDRDTMNIAAIIMGAIGGVTIFVLVVILFIHRARRFATLQSKKGDLYLLPEPQPASFQNCEPSKIPSRSMSPTHATLQKSPSVWREESGIPVIPSEDTTGSISLDISTAESQSLEGTQLPGITGPAPRVEALIAAAAPPEMSQEHINLLAANFVSLVRGRQVLDEEMGENGENAMQQPPPYQ